MESKKNWQLNEVVMPEDLNRIEGNIAAVNNSLKHVNLLNNWYLAKPVNQKNITAYAGAGYNFIDRWFYDRSDGTAKFYMNDGYISFDANSWIKQWTEGIPRDYNGKQMTASVLLLDGTILQKTFTCTTTDKYETTDWGSIGRFYETAKNAWRWTYTFNSKKDVVALKLELGTVSTLANDPPQDYGAELAKCQRYYLGQQDGYPFHINEPFTWYPINFILPVEMRIIPTVQAGCIDKTGTFVPNKMLNAITGEVVGDVTFHTPQVGKKCIPLIWASAGALPAGYYNITIKSATAEL